MKPALLADAKKQSVAALALLADAVCRQTIHMKNSLLYEHALTREGVYFFISADPS